MLGRGQGPRDSAGDAQHQRHPPRPRSELRPALAEIGVHVYLQFDGFEADTHARSAAATCPPTSSARSTAAPHAGVSVSLAAAIERDLNEHEVGAILRFGADHPAVTGVFFQPVTHSGRFLADADPLAKLTNPT